MEKLKKCPFCGSEDVKINKCTMKTQCKNCFATGPFISRFMKDGRTEEEAAVLAWNWRETNG